MFEAKGIDYIIEFPKQTIDCRLTMEVKSNFYLIFKEAVNNLCKYSDATQAGVKMTFDKTQIYLMVKDNGKGFIKEEVTHRGGLSNMEHRISEIKGKIKITSAPTKGTSIELSLPRYC
jgi:signal transduction histidine kinase